MIDCLFESELLVPDVSKSLGEETTRAHTERIHSDMSGIRWRRLSCSRWDARWLR